MNTLVHDLGDFRRGDFNAIRRYRFQHAASAGELSEYALVAGLHRLVANSTQGATTCEEVATEWRRIAQEREEILSWGRRTGMLRLVVQEYRAERHMGSCSTIAHRAAAKLVEKAYPSIANPMNYAGVFIVWAEREHRAWFWRCCRHHQVL